MTKRKPPKKNPPNTKDQNLSNGKITIGIGYPVSETEFKALKKKAKKGNK
jgi:hypothetical protein